MDARLEQILSQQQAAGFPGLAGSDVNATIRLSDQLLNQLIAAFLPANGPLRSVAVRSYAGNRLDVTLTLARSAFVPPIPLTLAVDRQPMFPNDPVIAFRVTGLAGGLMYLAAPLLGRVGTLPPGVRLDGDRLLVDLHAAAQQHRQAALLTNVRQLTVTTEDGRVVCALVARVP
jgi:hypothetical protein